MEAPIYLSENKISTMNDFSLNFDLEKGRLNFTPVLIYEPTSDGSPLEPLNFLIRPFDDPWYRRRYFNAIIIKPHLYILKRIAVIGFYEPPKNPTDVYRQILCLAYNVNGVKEVVKYRKYRRRFIYQKIRSLINNT